MLSPPFAAVVVVVAMTFGTCAANAADIPKSYSGPFPDTVNSRKFSGTYSNGKLSWTYVFRGTYPSSAKYTCTPASATTLNCDGTWRTNDGTGSGQTSIVLVWKDGKPVSSASR